MTAKKFASDSPVLKASLDLAMTANLFDPDGMLVDHGADILKMAKKAVPLLRPSNSWGREHLMSQELFGRS